MVANGGSQSKYRQYADIHGCMKDIMASCTEMLQHLSQEVFASKALGPSVVF